MRFGFVLLVMCLSAVSVARAETYRVSTVDFPDAQAVGGLLKEVYGKLGHDIELVFRPAKRSLMEVNTGQSDAEMARVIGTDSVYPNIVRVEEPVYGLSISAIVKATSKIWLSSWDELGQYKIGYPRGYQLLNVRTKDLDATRATDPAAVARMVAGGRFDVGVLLTSDAVKLAAENPELSVLTPPIESVTLYHYLNVKHRRLVPALEKVLIEMNDSGRARELLFGTQDRP